MADRRRERAEAADDRRDAPSDVWDSVQGSASMGNAAFEDYSLLHSRSKFAKETLQSLQEHFRHIIKRPGSELYAERRQWMRRCSSRRESQRI